MSLADFIAIHSFGSLDVSVKALNILKIVYIAFWEIILYRLYSSGHATETEIVY